MSSQTPSPLGPRRILAPTATIVISLLLGLVMTFAANSSATAQPAPTPPAATASATELAPTHAQPSPLLAGAASGRHQVSVAGDTARFAGCLGGFGVAAAPIVIGFTFGGPSGAISAAKAWIPRLGPVGAGVMKWCMQAIFGIRM
ncbi:hypothetical protein [Gordonia westfalica]|uniref:Uncharacterized protein n=1 Tax=Gordonia westfalica TaxID=158898 RepID=Q70KA2_9ACTN|nr:hypothetical protein [Gordonia westfalica]CAE09082.1 hypothetical protein [Gordonia westfalica]SDT93264.1 hypothetical protein SAMN04488548_130101 [Gordonia westfalica]